MREAIGKNMFVMTRDLVNDYHWICKPSLLNAEKLLFRMEEIFNKLSKTGNFTSKWYFAEMKGSNDKVVFRIVVDGRKDLFGRPIRRYEGSILPAVTSENISVLEKALLEKQMETNNYNYGFDDSLKARENDNLITEECLVEIKNGQVVIKSDVLTQFLQEHSYAELLELIHVEPNNTERKFKR